MGIVVKWIRCIFIGVGVLVGGGLILGVIVLLNWFKFFGDGIVEDDEMILNMWVKIVFDN